MCISYLLKKVLERLSFAGLNSDSLVYVHDLNDCIMSLGS
jgi:hypothetical protein